MLKTSPDIQLVFRALLTFSWCSLGRSYNLPVSLGVMSQVCHSLLQILSTSVRLRRGRSQRDIFCPFSVQVSPQTCVGVLPEGEPSGHSEALTSATATLMPSLPHTPDQPSWIDHEVLLLFYSALYYHRHRHEKYTSRPKANDVSGLYLKKRKKWKRIDP